MVRFITIAIDGAAASGKTTTARSIASLHNFMMVSTGFYYRIITAALLNIGVYSDQEEEIEAFLSSSKLSTMLVGNDSYMVLNGQSYTEESLREPSINENVALFSAIPVVRKFLFSYQRSQVGFAKENNFNGIVMEGRDITSVILPGADLKFFLEADPKERAARRHEDAESDCVSKRDIADAERILCNDDVEKIDTGKNDLSAVVEHISSRIREILQQ